VDFHHSIWFDVITLQPLLALSDQRWKMLHLLGTCCAQGVGCCAQGVRCCAAPDRYELLNTATSKIEVKHLSSEEAKNSNHFKDKESGGELEVQDKLPLLEWLANNYKKFGCALEFVTNK
jgi:hypothetical protein